MLVNQILTTTTKHIKQVACARNIGIMAPMLKQASDPIQSLFVEKIKEYGKNSEGGKKLFDASPAIQRELSAELEKIAKIYGGGAGVDLTKFPSFNFPEPKVDPVIEKPLEKILDEKLHKKSTPMVIKPPNK